MPISNHIVFGGHITSCLLSSRLGLQKTATVPLQRGKTPPTNECPRYDTKQSDGGVLVKLEL